MKKCWVSILANQGYIAGTPLSFSDVFQVLKSKCDGLSGEMTVREDKCVALEATVDQLQSQLRRQRSDVTPPSPLTPAAPSHRHDTSENWERTVRTLRADKTELEQRLETWRTKAEQLRASKERAEEQVAM